MRRRFHDGGPDGTASHAARRVGIAERWPGWIAPGERVTVVPPGPGDDGPKETNVDLRQLAERILAEQRFQPLDEPAPRSPWQATPE